MNAMDGHTPPPITVLESQALRDRTALQEAILRAGHRLIQRDDEWWSGEGWPALTDATSVACP
jgi:hypothetical protein